MRKFRDIPIKNKLSAIILLTSGILLLLTSGALITSEWFGLRRNMIADLFVLADLVGINSKAGLSFDDSITVEENIAALKANEHIILTYVFTPDGQLFAAYVRDKGEKNAVGLTPNLEDELQSAIAPDLMLENQKNATQNAWDTEDEIFSELSLASLAENEQQNTTMPNFVPEAQNNIEEALENGIMPLVQDAEIRDALSDEQDNMPHFVPETQNNIEEEFENGIMPLVQDAEIRDALSDEQDNMPHFVPETQNNIEEEFENGIVPEQEGEILDALDDSSVALLIEDELTVAAGLAEKTLSEYYFANPKTSGSQIKDNYFFHQNEIEIFKQIILENEMIGTVYIRADLTLLYKRLGWAISIVLIVLILSLLLGVLLASKLQQLFTTPIYNLLKTMSTVSVQKNYTLRAQKTGEDELGTLVDGFNEMLVQIDQYSNHLEYLVKQRTAQLAQARDQALAANKTKSVFLANMSHEIRTPMNAVLGYAQLLRRDTNLNQEQQDSLHAIEKSGNHLLGLINDILDISKIEAGAMELRPENFYISELIQGLSAMFKMRCEQKQLDWCVESTALKQVVYADQSKLRQILINLLGNAVKFTETGKVLLQVTQEAELYCFKVIDTGPGIPAEAQATIFKPFHQDTAGYDKGGTGLGLAISQQQVDLMGGALTLESELGKGACFTVLLPLALGEGEVVVQEKGAEIAHLAPGYHVSALVVDDVKENRHILSRILRDIGLEIREAVNGQDCLDQIGEQKPDIIFMDIRMPVMDGTEALYHIRDNFIDDKIICIAISASTLKEDTDSMLQGGFDHFIFKPFRFELIYECLDKFLNVEFEYKASESVSDSEDSAPNLDLDFTQLSLPKSIYEPLLEAAELSNLTAIETITAELREGNADQQALAKHFQDCLANYDTDSILEILEQMNPVEGTEPKEEIAEQTTVSREPTPLPKPLYESLLEAAEFGNLSALETLMAELREGTPEQGEIAKRFQNYLADYDTDGIFETLQKEVTPVEVEEVEKVKNVENVEEEILNNDTRDNFKENDASELTTLPDEPTQSIPETVQLQPLESQEIQSQKSPHDKPVVSEKTASSVKLSLPKSLYEHLYDAAELSDITTLESLTAELRQGTPEQQELAQRFEEALADYDTDSILETLQEQVQSLEEPAEQEIQEQEIQEQEIQSQKPPPDKAVVSEKTATEVKLSLPKSLYERLYDAAELSNVTALETLTAELGQGTPEQQELAQRFEEALADYDTDSIFETLQEQVQPLDE
ncbi:MAG: hypothetical protein DRR00_10785 [Candidatus Parabeggiatoa sp. nov. 3]|nr:MAG: hypothetical protein DRR00_10785 [Gammaproteobacteria bacterium]RKZ62530.1 MAG: hypothetical protein DRQ99_18565 [Gammaproteobacteria bacterium]